MTTPVAAQALIAELEQEAAATRRVLERVPVDKLAWKPHARSMTIGQLAHHVAGIPGSVSKMARSDGFDVAARSRTEPAYPENAEGLLPRLEESLADARAFLSGLDEESASAPWRLSHGEREVFTVPRLGMVRTMMLNHLYHHRGQLTVYLRLLDVPVPAVYGRSADENGLAQSAS
jgi:uncharacterized damage-inducible protein DinB